MKSKRIACIAMAGLMAASLAGCGGSDSDNKDTTEATKAATEAAGSDSADDTTADAEGIKSYPVRNRLHRSFSGDQVLQQQN